MFYAYHHITLSFHDGVDCGSAQSAGKDTVVCRRTAATLQVSEDCDAYVVLGIFVFHTFRIVHCTTGQFAFGNEHDAAVLRLPETVLDELFQLVHFRTEFRYDGSLGSGCDSAVQGKETGIASHNLDEEKTFVRSCGVADFVYGIQNRIQGGVVTDCGVRSVQVVVDGSRQTDTGHIKFLRKDACTGQRAVATDNHQGIDTLFLHVIVCYLPSFGRGKLFTACCFQDSTAQLDDVTYILAFEFFDFTGYQAFVTSIYAFNLKSVVDSRTCYRTDSRIHSRSVAARC